MSKRFRIVIADDNCEFCDTLRDYLAGVADAELVAIAYDGISAITAVEEHQPDVLLLDMMMPNLDGLGVLAALKVLSRRPRVLLLTALTDEGLIAQAVELGVDYYLMKPFDLPTLVQRLRQLAQPMASSEQIRHVQRQQQVEWEVANYIKSLGVPQHYKGYRYLCEAIILVIEDNSYLTRITQGLYPAIAERNGTTAHKVERSIRHAIETTWVHGNLDAIHRLFAYSVDLNKGKPTNSSFIARLADEVRMQLRAS